MKVRVAVVMALIAALGLGGCSTDRLGQDQGPLSLDGAGGWSLECIPATGAQQVSFGVVAVNRSHSVTAKLLDATLIGAHGVEVGHLAAIPLASSAYSAIGAATSYPPGSDAGPGWLRHVELRGAEVRPGASVNVVLGVRLLDPEQSGAAKAVRLDYMMGDRGGFSTTGGEGVKLVTAAACH